MYSIPFVKILASVLFVCYNIYVNVCYICA